jgi:UDP-N-acetylglucosamine 2-epimerase
MSSRTVPGSRVRLGTGAEAVSIDAVIAPEDAERAEEDANRWIKSLRNARVGGATFRDRFLHRGDSLWWFAEIYLHKRRIIVRALRAVYALQTLAAEGTASAWDLSGADHVVAHVAAEIARRHGISIEGASRGAARADRLTQAAKAVFHTSTAMADRLRVRAAPPATQRGVAAFVHSAFARGGAGEEAYIGPVLRAIELRVGADRVSLVGLGPRTNFRVRGWRDRIREFADPDFRDLAVTPVDAYSGWRELAPSRAVWRERREVAKALIASRDLRDAATISGCDLWPLVSAELEGVAELQFPWSARAMDEAGAALDHLSPDVVVTYAEAGGWGRALVLESRRRKIPVAAMQHGLIYRHWLNYLHEPDEILPSGANPADRGFPAPDCTLLFDEFAREHLERAGHIPAGRLAVTGSSRLDSMVAASHALDDGARRGLRESVGATPATRVVLVASKFTQIAAAFPAIVGATAAMPEVVLVVKPHPAEGSDPYLNAAGNARHVRISPAAVDLGALTTIADAIVTVNSTAAIEAMLLDVPALVVGLPNNLTPFVDAGAMAGVATLEAIGPALQGLLYDREMRERLAAARRAFIARYGLVADGGAAGRAADLIVGLTEH